MKVFCSVFTPFYILPQGQRHLLSKSGPSVVFEQYIWQGNVNFKGPCSTNRLFVLLFLFWNCSIVKCTILIGCLFYGAFRTFHCVTLAPWLLSLSKLLISTQNSYKHGNRLGMPCLTSQEISSMNKDCCHKWVELLLVLFLAPRVFLQVLRFSLHKTQHF